MFGRNNYPPRKFRPLKILFFLVVFIAFLSAAAWIVMMLWNAILPEVVGVKPLNIWKAAGLLILFKILFGGFGPGRKGWGKGRRKHWRKKWMNMNDAERAEARSRWKDYCNKRKSGNDIDT